MLELLKVLTNFDWITPTKGFVEDMINDPTLLHSRSWTFFIPYDQSLEAGWNANDILGLMARHGIKTWGDQYTWPQDEWFFLVPKYQAAEAEYLLNRENIPIGLGSGAPKPVPPVQNINNIHQWATFTIVPLPRSQLLLVKFIKWLFSRL